MKIESRSTLNAALIENPYSPNLATIEEIIVETWDTKTFKAVFQDESLRESFVYEPGQFQEVSVFGVGEAPFCLASSPTCKGFVEFSVKRLGTVTIALHEMQVGDVIGIRGPFGNWFPYHEWKGKKLIFVGGGIGMAPLRSLLKFCLDNRKDYGPVDIIYGARSPQDLCFKPEFDAWAAQPDTKLLLTVDKGDEDWKGNVGFVPAYLASLSPSPKDSIAITCGPPIMIKFVLQELDKLGFAPEQVYTTLEMKMKCGIGKCGRCNIGSKFVCIDGPVFSYADIKELPPEF